MTLGTLTLFISYIGMLMGPLQQMTQIADWLSRSTASAERVFEVIDAEPEIADTPDAVAMPHIEGHVEMKNVRFSYDKNQSMLEDVSVDVQPGRDDRPGRPFRGGQVHDHQPAVALLRCQRRADFD